MCAGPRCRPVSGEGPPHAIVVLRITLNLGKWSDASLDQVVISLQPFAAGHYLILDEIGQLGTGEPFGIKGIIGYDVSSERFIWYRVFSHGAWDRGVGRLQDGELVFDIVERFYEPFGDVLFAQPNVKNRTIWKDFGKDGWAFVWEQSVDGGPWQRESEGRNRRFGR